MENLINDLDSVVQGVCWVIFALQATYYTFVLLVSLIRENMDL